MRLKIGSNLRVVKIIKMKYKNSGGENRIPAGKAELEPIINRILVGMLASIIAFNARTKGGIFLFALAIFSTRFRIKK
ncbi:MAG: hypothetical protein EBS19_14585 [Spirochaetia bacterium]|nr:hypothetical protein [Spirochaetia bacterium]